MKIIPFSKTLENDTWNYYILPNGKRTVITRCTFGHIGTLSNHEICDDGTVRPSVVCQHEGCSFHEFIKLENYEGDQNV
jgi:hypothetical protein